MDYINLKYLLCLIILLVVTRCRCCINGDDDCDCELLLRSAMRRNPEKIFLFRTDDDQQIELNRKLIRWAVKLGFQIKSLIISSFPSCQLYDDITTIRLAAKYGTVINLRAKLILPENYGYFLTTFNDITLIGQSNYGENETEIITVCNSTDEYIIIKDEKYETCKHVSTVVYRQTAYIKVISKSIEKYKLLVKILESIEANDKDYDMYWKKYVKIYERVIPQQRLIQFSGEYILVCGSNESVTKVTNLSNRVIYTNDCKNLVEFSKVNIRVLAVIAAKPPENEDFNDFPIIFYDTPSITHEINSTFPNSMVLFNKSNKLLATGFLRLAKLANFKRIAIISDDAPHSKEFQRTIVEAFNKNDVIYAVKPSLKKKCGFEKVKNCVTLPGQRNYVVGLELLALEYFKKNEARIIIANIEEMCVQQVMETAAKLGLTAAAGIIWIFRDLSFDNRENIENLKNTYTIKLIPIIAKPTEMGLNSIAAAVNIVTETLRQFPQAVNKLKHDSNNIEEVGKSHARVAVGDSYAMYEANGLRDLADKYKRMRVKTYSADFQLQKFLPGRRHVVYAYNFETKKQSIDGLNHFNSVSTACYFSSHKFEHPCNDPYLLMIVLVLLGFLLTALILFEFFGNFTVTGIRYKNFV